MRRKQALWAASQYWQSTSQVSAHHYARLLVQRGWDVAFISHPISPWHFLKGSSRPAARERWRTWRQGGETDLDGHLLHYTPFTLCPPHNLPLLRSRLVLDWWPCVSFPSLRRYLAQHDFDRPDLLVIDSPLHGFLLQAFPKAKSVLRIVDNLSGFCSAARSWVVREHELVRQVDHVIVTARVLEKEVARHRPRALTHVPNGVQLEHFLHNVPAPEEYRDIRAPRAVYLGALEEWLDVDLLRHLGERLPEVSLVLIGAGRADLGPLRALPNVHILGRRPYAQVPGYLQHAAVGIIPFKQTSLTRAVNPIKLFEYLASGLPVVATAWEELEYLKSPARLCHAADEFVAAVAEVLCQPRDVHRLIDFARRADWQTRAQTLFGAIGVA